MPPLAFPVLAVFLGAVACPAAEFSPRDGEIPGYREESAGAAEFLRTLPECRIAVLPAIVRVFRPRPPARWSQDDRPDYDYHVEHAAAPRKTAMEFLKRHRLGRPDPRDLEPRLDPPGEERSFEHDLATLGKACAGLGDHDYSLTLVFSITRQPSRVEVGGIRVYVLDRRGHNAFSFFYTSANPKAPGYWWSDTTGDTRLALGTLLKQVEAAREAPRRGGHR